MEELLGRGRQWPGWAGDVLVRLLTLPHPGGRARRTLLGAVAACLLWERGSPSPKVRKAGMGGVGASLSNLQSGGGMSHWVKIETRLGG